MIMSALPVRSQKMEALGTMAGGIAHDFNSTLVPAMGYGELAQQCVGEGSPLRRYLDNIMLAASRPRELADRVLAFGRTGLTHRTPVEIQRVVAEALELLKVSLPPCVRLGQARSASNALVITDPAQLHRIIFFKLDLSSRNDRCEVQL
jgi:C4-dicarboxylate-specific signal transduction histidine kinase